MKMLVDMSADSFIDASVTLEAIFHYTPLLDHDSSTCLE